jgi:hypothetical protein
VRLRECDGFRARTSGLCHCPWLLVRVYLIVQFRKTSVSVVGWSRSRTANRSIRYVSLPVHSLAGGPFVPKTKWVEDCLWLTPRDVSLAVQATCAGFLRKLPSTLPPKIFINPRSLCFLNLCCAWSVALLGSSSRKLICTSFATPEVTHGRDAWWPRHFL